MLSELSSQKGSTLKKIFCTTFANKCPKMNLDETIGQVLTEDIRQKSMGITIDDSVEAHNSTESLGITINWFNFSRNQAKRTGRNSNQPIHQEDRQRLTSRSNQSSVFCIHCRKTGHDVSDCWSIKRKENNRRFERNTGRRLEPFSRRQSNQCCGHPIRRNPLSRGLHDRRSQVRKTHIRGWWTLVPHFT